jgi:hypothetical protein
MSAPRARRYQVLFWQRSQCKLVVSAFSEEQAMESVSESLANGIELDATVFESDYDVVCADEVGRGGAP